MKVTVITISDRASRGEYEDLSGPAVESILKEDLGDVEVRRVIVPDEEDEILLALTNGQDSDFVLTTGGTGISPRDITPEVTEGFCTKSLPGIAEALRAESLKETPMAMLSRGYAGMKGKTVYVNFPGSVKAVNLCTRVLVRVMPHTLKMLRGEGH